MTTSKDWTDYNKALAEYTMRKESTKPRRHEYATMEEYRRALRQWDFEFHVGKPDKPGAEYANNH